MCEPGPCAWPASDMPWVSGALLRSPSTLALLLGAVELYAWSQGMLVRWVKSAEGLQCLHKDQCLAALKCFGQRFAGAQHHPPSCAHTWAACHQIVTRTYQACSCSSSDFRPLIGLFAVALSVQVCRDAGGSPPAPSTQ